MKKLNIGRIYLFKEGKIRRRELFITEKQLKKANDFIGGNKCILSVNDKREFDGTNYFKNDLDIYKDMLEEGYSIIKITAPLQFPQAKVLEESKKLKAYISETVSTKDVENMYNMYLREEAKMDNHFVYNLRTDEFGNTYDFFDADQDRFHNASIILAYYLKEKIGDLDEQEKQMFQKYRNFDLEEVLTQNNMNQYPINNTNAAVIVITKDSVIQRSLSRMQHGAEFNIIWKNLYPNIDCSQMNIMEMVRVSNDIMIQVNLGEIIIWLPEERCPYQIEAMDTLVENLTQINEKLLSLGRPEISIYGANIGQMENEMRSIEQIKTELRGLVK